MRSPLRKGGAPPPAEADVEHSLLLPKLFEGLRDDERLMILDLGPAVPETVEFFGQFRCRLYFADLFSEPTDGDSATPFQTLLDYPVQVQFDLCLFWDFLNLLNVDELRAFNAALKPYVHRGTRAHGFAAMSATHALSIHHYGVRSTHELVVRPDPRARRAARPHPQAQLKQHLTCLEIKRGTLLREGRLEVLFQGV
ncbi:MAG: hypothetical protein E2O58_11430 [Gammaproteobacteria bacterium]|nr:MAG: hypothetical protein E2O58_11430 [Gammaproteobacteria bacterium]